MKLRRLSASGQAQPAQPAGRAATSPTSHVPRPSTAASVAFTLIELLAVIAIIGVIAMLVGPAIASIRKGDAMLSANRQLLGAVARARQLAMANHTTVYLVFVPPRYWTAIDAQTVTYPNTIAATNLAEKQLTGYTFISLRSAGDQPGQGVPRFLGQWQTLPESTFIPEWKFNPTITNYLTNVIGPPVPASPREVYKVTGFFYTNNIPFPMESAATNALNIRFAWLPYVAFNYLGQPIGPDNEPLREDAFIPLAHGSIGYAFDMKTRRPTLDPPSVLEKPLGNSTNSFNLVRIDRFTGRARLERQEIY